MEKILDSINLSEWEIETDSGWEDISHLHITKQFEVYELKTKNGLELHCADEHILFDKDFNEKFLVDLKIKDQIQTKYGLDEVKSIKKLNSKEFMFDFTVNSDNHRYYTNNILSHNTSAATVIILHYAIFNKSKTIGLLANKSDTAREILSRVQLAFENLPMFLKPGIKEWNKGSVLLENGSKIIASSTSSSAIRGKSCVTGDSKVCVEDGDDYYYIEIENIINNKVGSSI